MSAIITPRGADDVMVLHRLLAPKSITQVRNAIWLELAEQTLQVALVHTHSLTLPTLM